MKSPEPLRAKPLLHDTLSLLLPTAEQTWLLRACLKTGDEARIAWQTWQNCMGDPKAALAADRQGVIWLLPLLYQSLKSNALAAGRDLQPYLRTAYFREELRSQAYLRICHSLLAELATAGILTIVLSGAALAETVYADWALRHSGSLDLLVREEDGSRAEAALRSAGLSPPEARPGGATQTTRFRHESGLPVVLHHTLFPIPYYHIPLGDVWEASLERDIAGVPQRVLAPADMLRHICGQAACSRSRDSLEWVCDAAYLVQRRPDLDWHALAEGTLHSRLELPLSVMLGYLARDLGVPVPDQVLERLAKASTRTPSLGREAALTGVRAGARGTPRNLLAETEGWRSRAVVLKWMLLPSPACLGWSLPTGPVWRLPVYYLVRPLRYLARSLRPSTSHPLAGGP